MKPSLFMSILLSLAVPGAGVLTLPSRSAAQSPILTVSKTPGMAGFTTVQAAIDAANEGDIVEIIDSATYPEHLRISKNNVTLRAAAEQTPVLAGRPDAPDDLDLIDVSGTDGVTIRSLTLMGGTDDGITASPGPGATNLTIETCRFVDLNDTGIILNEGSSATIRDCAFSGLGTAASRLGNGVNVLAGSTVTLERNTFAGLGVGPDANGTAVLVTDDSTATLVGNSFADLRGPGVLAVAASVTVINNTFEGGPMNGDFSDGIELVGSSADIVANRFLALGRLGIGTFSQATDAPRRISTINIFNNLIVESGSALPEAGVGLQLVGSRNTRNEFNIVNNTIATNFSLAVLYALESVGSSVSLVNNILSGSLGGDRDIAITLGVTTLRDLSVRNCLIEQDVLMLVGQNGNISDDPQFVDPLSFDYHLLPTSPAIDAGDSAVPDLPDTDLDGNRRIAGEAVDMGALEFQPDGMETRRP